MRTYAVNLLFNDVIIDNWGRVIAPLVDSLLIEACWDCVRYRHTEKEEYKLRKISNCYAY